ncbi:MAG: hypothetical protein GVY18_01680 [Bacteroidetes bacterium]|jgi:hypothetical protein|nr:hypothetical protein [Bacteroidota bacterium]
MHPIDRALQPGSGWRIVLGLMIVLFFVTYAFVAPEHRFASFFVVILCGGGTWRHYVLWRRLRDQDGLELLGTDPGGSV